MSRKKVIPDLSFKIVSKKSNLFTDDDVADIAAQAGFHTSYPLLNCIEDASYRFISAASSVPVSMKRRALNHVADSAQAFKTSLNESAQVLHYAQSHLPPEIDVVQLETHLLLIESACKRADQDLANTQERLGSRADNAYFCYIRELHRIYEAGTGCSDKYSRDEYTGEYTGQFFVFLVSCLAIVGRSKKKSTIARDITKALTGV